MVQHAGDKGEIYAQERLIRRRFAAGRRSCVQKVLHLLQETFHQSQYFDHSQNRPVLWIIDILVRTRIRGSLLLTNGPDPDSDANKK